MTWEFYFDGFLGFTSLYIVVFQIQYLFANSILLSEFVLKKSFLSSFTCS